MSLLANSNAIESGGYNIDRSLRFRSSASAYLSRTPSVAGNRTTWTWSSWVKRGQLGRTQAVWFAGDNVTDTYGLLFDSTDVIQVGRYNAGWTWLLSSSAVYRDPSAWYHIVVAVDTTQATASNRVKIYVNGSQLTAFGTANYPSQNFNTEINSTSFSHRIGYQTVSNNYSLDGYLAEVNFIDGQALGPEHFGQVSAETGVWVPKKYTGTYGTNGFYLDFKDNTSATTLAYDKSGNGNNWTPNNISTTAGSTYDSMLDVPTPYADGGNGRGNYCVLNPLNGRSGPGGAIYGTRNGNLSGANYGSGGWAAIGSTIAAASGSGRWYWELTYNPTAGGEQAIIGIHRTTSAFGSEINGYSGDADGYSYGQSGNKFNNNTGSAYGATWASGDVIGIALDCSTAGSASVTFYRNNASQGVAFSGLAGDFMPAISTTTTGLCDVNFGQRPFAYTPPTGFKALNTQNLPDSTILKPVNFFGVKLDTGANIKATAEAVYGSGLYAIKDRQNANNWQWVDYVRGTSAVLQSNTTAAETTYSAPSGNSVAAVWKESVTAGFDIVTYTGTGVNRTVAHNLGVAPKMVIVKRRDVGGSWWVYNAYLGGAAYQLEMNSTAAKQNWPTSFNSTDPTSSVFSVGTSGDVNASGGTYVAYLFAEIAGFSKFGSYTGNGSADGPFVYCGFRPRFVMIKCTSAVEQWAIKDTARVSYNTNNAQLFANSSSAEDVNNTYHMIDFNANGFKIRGAAQDLVNGSGQTYIFMAFAESPFQFANAR